MFSGLLQEATGRRAEAADTFAAASRADRTDPVAAYLAASRLSSEAPEQLQLTAAVLGAATREPGAPGPFMQLELIPDSAARTPVFAPAHYAEGFALLSSRRFREAIEQFRAALKTDPLLSDRAHLNPDVRAGAAAMRENRTAAAIEYSRLRLQRLRSRQRRIVCSVLPTAPGPGGRTASVTFATLSGSHRTTSARVSRLVPCSRRRAT